MSTRSVSIVGDNYSPQIFPIQPSDNFDNNLKTQSVSNQIKCDLCQTVLVKKNLCSRCKEVNYCNADCQKTAWTTHKLICKPNPWDGAIKGLTTRQVKIKDVDAVAFELNKDFDSDNFFCFYHWYGVVVFKLMLDIERLVKENFYNTPRPLGIPCSDLIDLAKEHLKEVISSHKQLFPTTYTTKIEQAINAYFIKKPYLLFHSTTMEAFKNEIVSIHIEIERYLFAQLHQQGSELKKIILTDDLLKPFGMTVKESGIDLNYFSCAAYTLLSAGDVKAKDYIFDYDSKNNMDSLLDILQKNGFKPTQKPKKGDYALYFNDLNSHPMHMAQCLANGLVHSKTGLYIPFTIDHQIHNRPPGYGKYVVFFSNNQI